jgi:hypothetical protein
MSALPNSTATAEQAAAAPKPLNLPRTIIAMTLRGLLMNTSVAYRPHLLARFAFPKSFVDKLKAEQAAKKAAA